MQHNVVHNILQDWVEGHIIHAMSKFGAQHSWCDWIDSVHEAIYGEPLLGWMGWVYLLHMVLAGMKQDCQKKQWTMLEHNILWVGGRCKVWSLFKRGKLVYPGNSVLCVQIGMMLSWGVVNQGYSIGPANKTVFTVVWVGGNNLLWWQQSNSSIGYMYGMKPHGNWFVMPISKGPVDVTDTSNMKSGRNVTKSDILSCSVQCNF